MMITDNDRDSLSVPHEVADITKIITYIHNTALRNIYSAHQLDGIEVSPGYFCAGGEIWCFDYWSALELGALRKYQSAPPCTSEMEDKHMLE